MRDLAIHDRPGSYSDRWQELCRERGLPHRVVSGLDDGIVEQLRGCSALLAHWHHGNASEMRVGLPLAIAAEQMGLLVYPSLATFAHFDNKVAQKYVLESIGAPLVPSHVFASETEARSWLAKAEFPLVHKLSKGAGAQTVSLVPDLETAERIVQRAFGPGFESTAGYLADSRRKIASIAGPGDLLRRLSRMPRSILNRRRRRWALGRERGYVYFQEFVPDNTTDTRITIIGDRAFGFRRAVRENDFRASGSGTILYDADAIDQRCVTIAFEVTRRMGAQSMAFDFVLAADGPRIIEVSYGFNADAVHACAGHWDRQLAWIPGSMRPQDAILDDVLAAMNTGS